jgi:penicillin-binding protein 1A
VEIKDIPGVTSVKRAQGTFVASNSDAGAGEAGAGPPPVLTRRGADILVRVEKLLDEAAKTAPDTPPAPQKTTSTHVPASLTDSFASATREGDASIARGR